MENRNSNLFSLLAGAVAGGALVYYLRSENGQRMLTQSNEWMRTKIDSTVNNAKDMIDNGKQFIDNSKDEMDAMVNRLQRESKSKMDEFKNGMEQAKQKLESNHVS